LVLQQLSFKRTTRKILKALLRNAFKIFRRKRGDRDFINTFGNYHRVWRLLAIGENGATRIWGFLVIGENGASTGASPLPMMF
jgi:hypothetical protein